MSQNQFQSFPSSSNLVYLSKTHADDGYVITFNDGFILWTLTNGSNDTTTLPLASANPGKLIRVKLAAQTTAFNTLTIARAGSDTITLADGTTSQTSAVLYTAGEEYELLSDGVSVWQTLNHRTVCNITNAITYGTGLGTASNVKNWLMRNGNKLIGRGYFICGTTTANPPTLILPSGLTIDTAFLSTGTNSQMVGNASTVSSSASDFPATQNFCALYYDGSSSNSVQITNKVGDVAQQFTNRSANSFLGSSSAISYMFELPITGWKS